jgi:hypothetical protein
MDHRIGDVLISDPDVEHVLFEVREVIGEDRVGRDARKERCEVLTFPVEIAKEHALLVLAESHYHHGKHQGERQQDADEKFFCQFPVLKHAFHVPSHRVPLPSIWIQSPTFPSCALNDASLSRF